MARAKSSALPPPKIWNVHLQEKIYLNMSFINNFAEYQL